MRVNIISAVLMMIVSEWLLFNANSAISWREQVNFQWDDDEVRIVLDQHAELDFKVLAHWNNSPRVDMSLHLDTLFWYEPTILFSFSLILLVRDSSAVRRLFVQLAGVWDVRALSIRKTADLPLQLRVGTFPRFAAIGFYFLSETLI